MLRVAPFRGDQVAAGVVVLTALVVLLQVRMSWSAQGQLALALGAVAGVGVLVAGCPREARPYVSAIVTSGLILLAFALGRFGQVLGVDGLVGGAGPLTWKLVLLGLTAVALARTYDVAAATLVAGLALAFVPLTFFSWATDPSGGVQRLLLLVMAVGLALAAIGAGPLLVDVLITVLQLQDAAAFVGGSESPGWGWELALLIGGFGLLAYGAVDRRRGPVLVGLLVLASWIASAAGDGRGSLFGWPMVLVAAAAFMLGVGLRPTTPAPPDPLEDDPEQPTPTPLRYRGSEELGPNGPRTSSSSSRSMGRVGGSDGPAGGG
ncbi:MAG: hypothetical protein M3417_08690 [Actinomycetota bacterium]|nr:hypothetical protein [Actinomycetota bacterium]